MEKINSQRSINNNINNNIINYHSKGDDYQQGLFAARSEHSYQFKTRTDFNNALSQIDTPVTDHITLANLPSSQEEWDALLNCGNSQHKMIYIYPYESLVHVISLYVDIANKKIYSLPDDSQINTLATGYTLSVPASDAYSGERTLQDDARSCSYIAYQFGKKIESLLMKKQELISIASNELPEEIKEDKFIFRKKAQGSENRTNYYLLPESFYGITQRQAPIILNEALVILANKKALNSPIKLAPAQYKIEFEKYFMRNKSLVKTDKYNYVFNNIGTSTYPQSYRQKISAVKAPLIAELNRIRSSQHPQQEALKLAVSATLLTGAIPSENFYNEFKLTEHEFVELLIATSFKIPKQIQQLIKDLQLTKNDHIVEKIISGLGKSKNNELNMLFHKLSLIYIP